MEMGMIHMYMGLEDNEYIEWKQVWNDIHMLGGDGFEMIYICWAEMR
jgi:hypothetical protein